VDVREDPRITVAADVRAAWTANLVSIADTHRRATQLVTRWQQGRARFSATQRQETALLNAQLEELLSRLGRLYGDVEGWTGPMTADQRTRLDYLTRKLAEFGPTVDRMLR
jgi:hypothetical protein